MKAEQLAEFADKNPCLKLQTFIDGKTKVTCTQCEAFLGFICTNTGTGPWLSECAQTKLGDCAAVQALERFASKQRPLGLGGRGGPWDEDAGGYQSIAKRALEDQDNP